MIGCVGHIERFNRAAEPAAAAGRWRARELYQVVTRRQGRSRPDHRRGRGARPGHARHRSHRWVTQSSTARCRPGSRTAAAASTRTWSARHRADQRGGGYTPGELAVADEGAGDMVTGNAAASSPIPDRRPDLLPERHRALAVGPRGGLPRGVSRGHDPVAIPKPEPLMTELSSSWRPCGANPPSWCRCGRACRRCAWPRRSGSRRPPGGPSRCRREDRCGRPREDRSPVGRAVRVPRPPRGRGGHLRRTTGMVGGAARRSRRGRAGRAAEPVVEAGVLEAQTDTAAAVSASDAVVVGGPALRGRRWPAGLHRDRRRHRRHRGRPAPWHAGDLRDHAAGGHHPRPVRAAPGAAQRAARRRRLLPGLQPGGGCRPAGFADLARYPEAGR